MLELVVLGILLRRILLESQAISPGVLVEFIRELALFVDRKHKNDDEDKLVQTR